MTRTIKATERITLVLTPDEFYIINKGASLVGSSNSGFAKRSAMIEAMELIEKYGEKK